LRHWSPTDDPWLEHARHFGNCAYIHLIRGCYVRDIISAQVDAAMRAASADAEPDVTSSTRTELLTAESDQSAISSSPNLPINPVIESVASPPSNAGPNISPCPLSTYCADNFLLDLPAERAARTEQPPNPSDPIPIPLNRPPSLPGLSPDSGNDSTKSGIDQID